VLGYLAPLYGTCITALGIRELYGTTTARAFLAVLVLDLPLFVWSIPNATFS
jgi:hypothetical protein